MDGHSLFELKQEITEKTQNISCHVLPFAALGVGIRCRSGDSCGEHLVKGSDLVNTILHLAIFAGGRSRCDIAVRMDDALTISGYRSFV